MIMMCIAARPWVCVSRLETCCGEEVGNSSQSDEARIPKWDGVPERKSNLSRSITNLAFDQALSPDGSTTQWLHSVMPYEY